MTQDDFEEICREALIERHLLADFSPGSIDKVTRTIMKVVKNRLEAEMLSSIHVLRALGLADG